MVGLSGRIDLSLPGIRDGARLPQGLSAVGSGSLVLHPLLRIVVIEPYILSLDPQQILHVGLGGDAGNLLLLLICVLVLVDDVHVESGSQLLQLHSSRIMRLLDTDASVRKLLVLVRVVAFT